MRPSVHCELVNGPFGDPVVYADVMFERRALLFDIGDVSALSPRKLLRVSHVFVSHAHMDHFAGFDRLLRLALGRDKRIMLFGPAGFVDRVEHKLHAYTWNVVERYAGNLVFDVSAVQADGVVQHARFASARSFRRESLPDTRPTNGVLSNVGGLSVRCAVLDHDTPCLGFTLQEPRHVNVWKARLEARGLTVGPWLRALKRAVLDGADDTLPIPARRHDGGTEVLPLSALRDVVRIVAGQKVAYVVDARGDAENVRRIVQLVRGADLLFIEAAFMQADAEQAAHKNHLTAWQAGTLAHQAQVRRLVPCHFSTRYADRDGVLEDEAQRAFLGSASAAVGR